MNMPPGVSLLATVCNTTPNAVPYALWYGRGQEQFLIDLSDVLGTAGDGGLTGLSRVGERIYVAVQTGGVSRILVLDRRLNPLGAITNPEFSDIHSLHGVGDKLLVCSTGRRSVLRLDLASHAAERLCEFEPIIHLNSACFADEDLLICCHYPEHIVPGAIGGGVVNATRRQAVLGGLTQPHSLMPARDGFLILDSDGRRVLRFDRHGITGQQTLPGFLRGMGAAAGRRFIATSAGRIISRKNPSVPPGRGFWQAVAEPVCIYQLDAASLAVQATHRPLVAGFEIYELLAFDQNDALDPAPERLIVPDQNALARAYYEAAKHALAQAHRPR